MASRFQACVELLEEENVEIPSWLCFGSVDGENAPSGESFKDCLDIINKSKKVNAIGINCAPPHFIDSLICKFKEVTLKFTTPPLCLCMDSMFLSIELDGCVHVQLTEKPIVVYPNSGEVWDGRAKRWLVSPTYLHSLLPLR